MSFPPWLVNWGLRAGIDPNWKLYYSGWQQGCTLALLLCQSMALNSPTFPLPQSTAAIHCPNSVIMVILFTPFSENLALEQLVRTAPRNISADNHIGSSREITWLFCVCVAVLHFPYNTVCCVLVQSAQKTCSACCRRIIRKTQLANSRTHTFSQQP